MKLLGDHYRLKPVIAVERLKFHTRVRQSSESVSSYIAHLRELSEFCEFGATLDDMLRNRLVCGINNTRIQKLLLTESSNKLTFKRAQELAESAEAAEKSVQDVVYTSQKPQINVVLTTRSHHNRKTDIDSRHHAAGSTTQHPNNQSLCYRCGGKRVIPCQINTQK